MNKDLKKIIKRAIDIHVHIGPEIIPRKHTVSTLIEKEEKKLGGCVLKNHFYPTSPFIKEASETNFQLFGGLVLNNFVGGLNPEAIYAASLMSNKPIMVWYPTVNSQNFLQKSEYEIAPEWVNAENFKGRKAKDTNGISLLRNGMLKKEVITVLQTIKKTNAILATGHISVIESEKLVEKAIAMGIKKIVITHPIYQRIDMSINIQKEFAKLGCFIEQSYSMYSIDKLPIEKISQQIRAVGATSIILSSDVGQPFSPSPSEALYMFGKLLIEQEFSLTEIELMMVKNPKKLLGIE